MLTRAPAIFQTAINMLFGKQLGWYVCVHLADIFLFQQEFIAADHQKHLIEVLTILEQHKLYATLSKCDLNRAELLHLRHIVGAFSKRFSPARIAALTDWLVCENLRGLRSFLGFTNYLRNFIQEYAKLCLQSTNMTCKEGLARKCSMTGLRNEVETGGV